MRVFAGTDIGKAREKNQDFYYISHNLDEIKLCILADGMGGYAGGEVASNLAVISVKNYIYNNYSKIKLETDEIINLLKDATQYANMVVYEKTKQAAELEDMGTNYMNISDFELFMMLSRTLTPKQTGIILGDLDLSKFILCKSIENDELCMYCKDNGIVIDNLIYLKIADYLRKLHNIKSKVEKAYNETTRKILIQIDRERIEKAKNKPYKSQLKELISAMMRYPGFKYKKNELKECGLYEFMDAVQGAQVYVSTTSLLSGMYSGMIDTSKINKKELNWMRNANE